MIECGGPAFAQDDDDEVAAEDADGDDVEAEDDRADTGAAENDDETEDETDVDPADPAPEPTLTAETETEADDEADGAKVAGDIATADKTGVDVLGWKQDDLSRLLGEGQGLSLIHI